MLVPGLSRATAGPRETFSWGPQTFSWGPSGKKIFEFFSKWYILAYFVFLVDGGAPKHRRARGSLPPYLTLLTGLVDAVSTFLHLTNFWWELVKLAACNFGCNCCGFQNFIRNFFWLLQYWFSLYIYGVCIARIVLLCAGSLMHVCIFLFMFKASQSLRFSSKSGMWSRRVPGTYSATHVYLSCRSCTSVVVVVVTAAAAVIWISFMLQSNSY